MFDVVDFTVSILPAKKTSIYEKACIFCTCESDINVSKDDVRLLKKKRRQKICLGYVRRLRHHLLLMFLYGWLRFITPQPANLFPPKIMVFELCFCGSSKNCSPSKRHFCFDLNLFFLHNCLTLKFIPFLEQIVLTKREH